MSALSLTWANVWRNPIRTLLLITSLSAAFLVFAVIGGFHLSAGVVRGAPNRLVTLNRVNFTETLPIAYFTRIQAMREVAAATHINWFGGYYRERSSGFLPVSAVDPASFLQVYQDEVRLTAAQRASFLSDRRALIVSRAIAEQFNWRVGQQIPLMSYIYVKPDGSRDWDFILVGIFDPPSRTQNANGAVIHYNYINESVAAQRDRIGWVSLLTTSPERNSEIARLIDAQFANSTDETLTEDAQVFGRALMNQFGDLRLVVTSLLAAAFVAALLIVGTTLSAVAQARRKEFALMKALGFSGMRLVRMIVAEGVLICMLGALVGLSGGTFALKAIADRSHGAFGELQMPPIVLAGGVVLALVTAFVTSLIPATLALFAKPKLAGS